MCTEREGWDRPYSNRCRRRKCLRGVCEIGKNLVLVKPGRTRWFRGRVRLQNHDYRFLGVPSVSDISLWAWALAVDSAVLVVSSFDEGAVPSSSLGLSASDRLTNSISSVSDLTCSTICHFVAPSNTSSSSPSSSSDLSILFISHQSARPGRLRNTSLDLAPFLRELSP